MKLKFTPLLAISMITALLGVIFILPGIGGNLGPLIGILILVVGVALFLLYLLFRKIFKTKTGTQVVFELILIITALLYWSYMKAEHLILHVPEKFQGYIIVVYGVDKMPGSNSVKVPNLKNDITVPESGILFTSNKKEANISIVETLKGKEQTLQPGYGISFSRDTVHCGNNKYLINILYGGETPVNWSFQLDSSNRNSKKEMVCKILGY